jgi:hypothetical protein
VTRWRTPDSNPPVDREASAIIGVWQSVPVLAVWRDGRGRPVHRAAWLRLGEDERTGRIWRDEELCTPVAPEAWAPLPSPPWEEEPVTEYAYTLGPGGAPLAACPECGHDLTAPGGVAIVLSVGGATLAVPSRLGPDGTLEDVDRAVANGYHAGTYCGGCDELLADLDGVDEEGG